MFCQNCGKSLTGAEKFCVNCGAKVESKTNTFEGNGVTKYNQTQPLSNVNTLNNVNENQAIEQNFTTNFNNQKIEQHNITYHNNTNNNKRSKKITGIIAIVLSIIILILVACVIKNNGGNIYRKDILGYLETKYNEEFVIEKLSKIRTIGLSDKIYASCVSERFPGDLFEVEYVAEEQLFSDNYINVIVQNAFDEKLDKVDAIFVKTQITTPNQYLNVYDKNITPDDFFANYGNDVVVYTSIFVNDESKLEDNEFLSNNASLIVSDRLRDQFVFYYVTNLEGEEIETLYAQNYDNNNEYFYEAKTTKKYMFEKYSMGEKESVYNE